MKVGSGTGSRPGFQAPHAAHRPRSSPPPWLLLSVWPVGPTLFLLHFSKNTAYAQPPPVLRLLCLPHPPGLGPGSSWASPGARARVHLGLTWGSGPALLVVGTAPASPVRPPASTPAPEGTLPTPRPPHAVACRLPYFLHSTGNCLVQLFTMLLSEYLQDANSRRVALLSVPDIAQVAQGNNTR